MHHVHSANINYQNPYYGQVGHHNINFPHQAINYNNPPIHVQVPIHNYNQQQNSNLHYNNQQFHNQAFDNNNLYSGLNYPNHVPQYHQNIHQSTNIVHNPTGASNQMFPLVASSQMSPNINMNLTFNGSGNSQVANQAKHWT